MCLQSALYECWVVLLFSFARYRSAMPDDDKLTPASPRDIEICLSMALTSGRGLARAQAAETMAKIVAERLVEHLDAAASSSCGSHRRIQRGGCTRGRGR
jgi:hypothetical protein